MAAAQYAQVYLEFLDLSRIFVRYMELFARKIDEELVARLMGEVHHWRCLLCPFTVPVPELGELEPVRVLRMILFPEQLSRDPRFAEFPVKIGEVPLQGPQLFALGLLVRLEEPVDLLQGHLRDLVGRQSVALEELDVLGHRVAGDAKFLADVSLAGPLAVQFVNPFCLSHIYLFVRHGLFYKRNHRNTQIESIFLVAHFHPPHYAHFGPPRVAHFDPPKVVYYARFLQIGTKRNKNKVQINDVRATNFTYRIY